MKIRAFELTNLRRFAGQRARIEGIGDGITVLSEPNEFGKSTFFDALHALFFQPHRSQKAPVKALQPHAGGAPEAALEIELPEGRFRLEKRWLSRPTARVMDASGRLIAQEDEAEAWIERLTGQGLAGPSGLLWMRQGLLGIEPEGNSAAEKSERERALAARRDLLSSVAGEIEMMTGGRRMDQVTARVTEALSRLATATLRPKAGGEWARAVDKAAMLAEQRRALEEKAARLTGDLRRRAGLQDQLRKLADPEAQARDAAALAEATRAHAAAETHAEQIRKAEDALRLAELTAAQGTMAIERLEGLRSRLSSAQAAQEEARKVFERCEARLQEAKEGEAEAQSAHEAARATARALSLRWDGARRARLARAAREKVSEIGARLEKAEELRAGLEQNRAIRAGIRVTPALLATVEKALAVRDRMAVLLEARLVSVRFSYDGAVRVHLEGQALGTDPVRLRHAARFDLPGIGTMMVDPGATADSNAEAGLADAETALARALAACAAPDLAAARQAQAEAVRLDGLISNAEGMLSALAPEGLEALRETLAAARSEASEASPTEEEPEEVLSVIEAEMQAAKAHEEQCLARRHEAETRRAAASERRAVAQATLQAAAHALDAAQVEAGDPVALSARLMNLAEAQEAFAADKTAKAAALAEHRALAPDLETTAAAMQRLISVRDQRQNDLSRLTTELAGVNGSIGALADEGIEEALDEMRGREEAVLARAARYEQEIRALARLRAALEEARRAAREAYFGPVLHELEPLLAILHPGAALQIDDETLLPVALTRDGQQEGFDILSGGTREQIAILTRLAFARLFARSGRPVPVILDDALVHSDDDRIEAMFTALHRVARDQQIIVLTCRQRAFASLGGERLNAKIEAV